MFLHVHGRRLEAAWWGTGDSRASPIVLLHEGLGSVSRWRDVPEELAARTNRRVMAYSRLGHGASDPPPERRRVRFMHDEAHLLPAVLDAAGIERGVLLGHSDGASIALIAAAEYPPRVESLILEAPHVFVENISVAAVEQTVERYRHEDMRERLAKHHRDVDLTFHGWSDLWLDPEFRSWNLEELLSRVGCPVLLIQGEQDQYGTLRQVDAIEHQVRGPVERLILPDCGHSPHRDQRERVLCAVTDFVWAHSRDSLRS